MNEPIYADAEFEPIEEMFKNRGRNADRLPGKKVRFIPEERAETMIALDKRVQNLQMALPVILFGLVILFAFLACKAV